MNATITYTLSAAGQKAALAAGLPAAANQTAVIEVSAADIDLFNVNSTGALSADLCEGSKSRGYSYESWERVAFDTLLTAEAVVAFLRERAEQRAVVLAAEAEARTAQKLAATEKAAAQRQADRLTLQVAVTNADLTGITCYSASIRIDAPWPAREYKINDAGDDGIAALVVEILEIHAENEARRKAKAERDAAHEALLKSIPGMPIVRPTSLQTDGRLAFTVPEPGHDGAWSKHVTSVDAAGQNGTAFDGPWLKCGVGTVLAPGEVIVVGSKWWSGSRKNGEWHKTRDIYVATPAGVLGAGGNSAQLGAELLALDPAERVTRVLQTAIATCEKQIAKFEALDLAALAEIADTVAERQAAWCARLAELQAALDKASAPAPITSVADAAAAIIAAGYKAMANQFHPDKGGDAVTMGLLTDARNSLRELLALANEVAA